MFTLDIDPFLVKCPTAILKRISHIKEVKAILTMILEEKKEMSYAHSRIPRNIIEFFLLTSVQSELYFYRNKQVFSILHFSFDLY